MAQVAGVMRASIRKVVSELGFVNRIVDWRTCSVFPHCPMVCRYTSDIDDLTKTTKAAHYVQIQVAIRMGHTGVVRIIVEIEKPNAELKGCITFVRKTGEASQYLQLLQKFAQNAGQ